MVCVWEEVMVCVCCPETLNMPRDSSRMISAPHAVITEVCFILRLQVLVLSVLMFTWGTECCSVCRIELVFIRGLRWWCQLHRGEGAGGMRLFCFPSIPQCVIGSQVQLLPHQIHHMSAGLTRAKYLSDFTIISPRLIENEVRRRKTLMILHQESQTELRTHRNLKSKSDYISMLFTSISEHFYCQQLFNIYRYNFLTFL